MSKYLLRSLTRPSVRYTTRFARSVTSSLIIVSFTVEVQLRSAVPSRFQKPLTRSRASSSTQCGHSHLPWTPSLLLSQRTAACRLSRPSQRSRAGRSRRVTHPWVSTVSAEATTVRILCFGRCFLELIDMSRYEGAIRVRPINLEEATVPSRYSGTLPHAIHRVRLLTQCL